MTEDHGKLRISHADREKAIAQLQAALDEGRIDLVEFDERAKTAYEAKTNAELDLIFDDLPGGRPKEAEVVPVAPAETPAQSPHGHPHGGPPWIHRFPALRGLITVGAITTGIWVATWIGTGEPTYFWPIWPILGLGIATVMQFVGGGWDGHGHEDEHRSERRGRRDRRRRDRY